MRPSSSGESDTCVHNSMKATAADRRLALQPASPRDSSAVLRRDWSSVFPACPGRPTPAALGQQVDDQAPSTESHDDAERVDRLREILELLVEDGTITSDQADAVSEHLVEAAPEGRMHRHGP